MSKVVVLGTAFPFRGGLAAFNERLAHAFSSSGDEVKIHTFSVQYPNILFPGKSQYSDEAAPDDLNIERSVSSVNPLSWVVAGKKIRKEAPDILVVKFWLPFMGPALGTVCRQAKKNGKTKVVCIVDNIIPHEKRPGDRAFINYFIKSVDAFVVMSRSVEEDLKKLKVNKPFIYNPHPVYDNFGEGVDRNEALGKIKLPKENTYLLFFGFIRKYKGLDLLLKSLATSKLKKNKNLKLIVAGEFYTNEKPYLDLIEEHGLQDQVILRTDFIPDSLVKYYFSAADLVVQPYLNATQSGVTQIAYHFDKPMIVTKVGGLPELIPDGKVGYVVEPEKNALATAVENALKPGKLEQFRKNVKEEKKRFAWDTLIGNIKSLAGSE